MHGDALAATQTADNRVSADLLAGVSDLLAASGLSEGVRDGLALSYLSNVVHAQAESFAFQDCFLALAAVFAFAILPAWLLGQAQRRA